MTLKVQRRTVLIAFLFLLLSFAWLRPGAAQPGLPYWTEIQQGGAVPAPLWDGASAYDPSRGLFYVFGGRANAGMMAYTESTNRWTTVAATPPSCFLLNLPTWRSKLVMADSQFVRVFNPTTQIWETPIPLPALAAAQGWTTAVAGAAGDLYLIGWAGGSTSIYKWVFN